MKAFLDWLAVAIVSVCLCVSVVRCDVVGVVKTDVSDVFSVTPTGVGLLSPSANGTPYLAIISNTTTAFDPEAEFPFDFHNSQQPTRIFFFNTNTQSFEHHLTISLGVVCNHSRIFPLTQHNNNNNKATIHNNNNNNNNNNKQQQLAPQQIPNSAFIFCHFPSAIPPPPPKVTTSVGTSSSIKTTTQTINGVTTTVTETVYGATDGVTTVEKATVCEQVMIWKLTLELPEQQQEVRSVLEPLAGLDNHPNLCRVEDSAYTSAPQPTLVIYATDSNKRAGNRFSYSQTGNRQIVLEALTRLQGPASNTFIPTVGSFVIGTIANRQSRNFQIFRDDRPHGHVRYHMVGQEQPIAFQNVFSNNGFYVTASRKGLAFHAFGLDHWIRHHQHQVTTFENTGLFPDEPLPAAFTAQYNQYLFIQGPYSPTIQQGQQHPTQQALNSTANILQAVLTTDPKISKLPVTTHLHSLQARGPMAADDANLYVVSCGAVCEVLILQYQSPL